MINARSVGLWKKKLQLRICCFSDALSFSFSPSLSILSKSLVVFKAAVLAAVQSELGVFHHLAG